MADLDDFFAKKDRKKKPTKKFATPEELAKKIDETVAIAKKAEIKVAPPPPPRKEAVLPEGAVADETVEAEEPVVEDEWKDFEEEGRKDYTGLKIGQMQIKDDFTAGSDVDGEGVEIGDDGERRRGGPWNKMGESAAATAAAAAAAATAAATASKEPVAPKPEPAQPEKSKLYVSPAMRNMQTPLKPINIRKGAAPDLANEEYFPTLGSVRPEDLKKKKNEPAFEEVKHGGRFQRSSDLPTNAPVSIGNRYNSLSDS